MWIFRAENYFELLKLNLCETIRTNVKRMTENVKKEKEMSILREVGWLPRFAHAATPIL